ncbi:MAG: S-layer homology domain-containing protein [Oscillospiraceae bacterium]|nr:S-layer homology domain-containing protein [Oscillospiraceae bacterium]
MKKTFKRVLVLLLAAITLAAMPLSALASEPIEDPASEYASDAPKQMDSQPASEFSGQAQEGSMETALVAVKSLLDIDDEVFTDFSYGSSYSNYETREGLQWTFSWSAANNGYIYAVAQADGTLMQYSKYDYKENMFGFAEVSKDEAVELANAFIKRAKPDGYAFFKTPNNVNVYISDSEYRIMYYSQINGYDFQSAYISMNVNKFTGEITSYNTTNIDPNNFNFAKADVIIGEAEAIAAYADKIGLRMEYLSYFNYEDGSIKVFPVYMFNSFRDRYIGAATGDIVNYVYDLGFSEGGASAYDMNMPAPESANNDSVSGAGRQLTPAEIAAIEKVSNYISPEKALSNLLDAMELSDMDFASFNERYINLNRDYMDWSKYAYDISYYRYYSEGDTPDDDIMGFSGRVDAESGRVTSFYMYFFGNVYSVESEVTDEMARAVVEEFLKKNAPDEFAKCKPDETASVTPLDSRRNEGYFNYVRYENDLAFGSNGISATYNRNAGRITRYSLNWYDNVDFPGVDGALSQGDALAAFIEQVGSSVMYVTTGEGNAELVYSFASGMSIDPFTGLALNYDGEPWANAAYEPDYSDVEGHWSEAVVKRLVDNGIYMWSGSFEPNKVMTELEFLEYLLLLEPAYYRAQPIDDYFMQRGVEIDADPDKVLTRQEAVRIIVEYLGYGKLAKQSKWFVYPFSDDVDEGYKGYITICYMLGIIGGDNGRFNAGGNITRAQAAVIVYNLVIAKS